IVFFRASTQAGKTSGFSSQTNIHCAISSFWVRFSGVLRGVTAVHFARSLAAITRSEEHTSELQSRQYLVCRLLLEKKQKTEQKEEPRLSLRVTGWMRSAEASA